MKRISILALFILLTSVAEKTLAQAKPDLVVREIISIEPFFDSARNLNRVRVLTKIGNAGAASSGNSLVEMRIYQKAGADPAGWYGLPPVGIPGISAKKDTMLEVVFTDQQKHVSPGRFPVQLLLDPRRMVDEGNETNNTLNKELTIQGDNPAIQITEVYRPPATVQATGTIRALTAFSANFNTPGDFLSTSSTVEFITRVRYNHDQQNIQVQKTGVTLKKGGIYHFDIFFQSQLQFKSFTQIFPWVNVNLKAGTTYEVIYEQYPMVSSNTTSWSNDNFFFGKLVSVEVYVPAGTTVTLIGSVDFKGVARQLRSEDIKGKSFSGYLSGYLVKEF
ncbi:MAG: hypothetical protein J0M30_07790 [Chitinophagales bacterium]|nr:hypothetical protein [Chitinophagales bacterium]